MGPLALILFVFAGISYSRRKQLDSLAAADYPTVAPDRFEEWRRLELKSVDIFLRVAAVLFLMSIVLSLAMWIISPAGRDPSHIILVGALVIMAAYVLVFLVGLTVSAIIGSKAARLKKSLSIDWPRRR